MLRNQKGFSLIELMIAVAIIGVLASIAVPNYQGYINKTREASVKTHLSGFYTANQIFYGEWAQYFGDWRNLGFSVDGDLYYRFGFGDAGAVHGGSPTVPPAYTGPGLPSGSQSAIVNSNPNSCAGPPDPCTEITPFICALNVINKWEMDSFIAGACGMVTQPDGTVSMSRWSIDESKKLRNTLVP